jgi:oligopeptide transport system ATP-binding protein
MAADVCTEVVPPLEILPGGRSSACLFAEELVAR